MDTLHLAVTGIALIIRHHPDIVLEVSFRDASVLDALSIF